MNPAVTTAPPPIELQQLQQHPVAEIRQQQMRAAESLPLAMEASPFGSVMGLLERAVDRGMDVNALQQLVALAERMQAAEARRAFDHAMAEFRSEVLAILKTEDVKYKNKDGSWTNYSHATLAGVIDVLSPVLSKYGLSYFWKPEQGPGWVRVTCELRHRMGHSERSTITAPPDKSGGKNDVQAIISTVSYLERHTLKAVCGVAERDEDREQPRDQLTDDELWDGVPAGLRKAAEQAADKGSKAYEAFWAATGKENRKALGRPHPLLKLRADAPRKENP